MASGTPSSRGRWCLCVRSSLAHPATSTSIAPAPRFAIHIMMWQLCASSALWRSSYSTRLLTYLGFSGCGWVDGSCTGRCPPRDRRWEDEEDEGMRRAVAATCRDGPGALAGRPHTGNQALFMYRYWRGGQGRCTGAGGSTGRQAGKEEGSRETSSQGPRLRRVGKHA